MLERIPDSLLKISRKVRRQPAWLKQLHQELQDTKLLSATILTEQIRSRGILNKLSDAEFKAYSQFGDDGIIQYLIQRLQPKSQSFVEFGVETYREANTRLLLLKDNWRGLIMDGNAVAMQALQSEDLYWRHDIKAVAAFITKDNINDLISENGFAGELGVLSIDIDGNDYWVWEALRCVQPQIVVAEYNSVFGATRAVSVPYDAKFQRSQAHHSNLYWGCSLAALCHLAAKKNYAFIGSNSNGNNAYFVPTTHLGELKPLSAEAGYVESRFRESRDTEGRLTFLSGKDRIKPIAALPLIDVTNGKSLRVSDL